MLRELIELREESAKLSARLAGLEFRRAAGLPLGEGLRDVLGDYRQVTSADGLAQAEEALAEAEEEDPKRPGRVSRLSCLRDFLVRMRAIELEPDAAEELFELPRRPLVRPPGDAGLHGALPEVSVERDLPFIEARDKRAQMEEALSDALSRLDGTRSAAFEAGAAAAGRAPDRLHARGWSGPASRASAEKLLTDTDPLVKDLGGWLLERHTGIQARDAERHDVLRLVHAPRCASAFPKGELLRTVRRWAEMLRLDLGADGAIRLDDDERPLKRGGAVAIPLDPPFDVRISLFPQEGPHALAQLLGAVSVAQLRCGPPGDAPPEDLWLSDPAVDVACGSLLSALARDPGFLQRCAKADLKRDDLRAIAIASLFEARLAAARTLGSLEALESGPTSRAADTMRELHARAMGASLPKGLSLALLDPFLGPWGELRGLALAARMRAFLVERFDEDWWRNPRSLASLHGLWSRGGRPTAAELWAELGGEMSVAPLSAELTAAVA